MGRFVIVVNGKPRAGKDTFAEILSNYTSVYKWSIIDPIKALAIDLGWKGGKEERDRKFLAGLKKLTDEYTGYARQEFERKITEFDFGKIGEDVLIVDMREIDDIKYAVEEYNVVTVYINNDNVPEITSNHADASTNIDDYDYDYIVDNSGSMEDFEDAVKIFYFLLEMGESAKNDGDENIYGNYGGIDWSEFISPEASFADLLNELDELDEDDIDGEDNE